MNDISVLIFGALLYDYYKYYVKMYVVFIYIIILMFAYILWQIKRIFDL